jgi:ABC-type multidrug transport system fused ATPase/permease subunit
MQKSEDKNKTKKQVRRGIKAIIRHTIPFRKQMWVLVALGLLSAVANGAVPYVTGRFFDALVNLSQSEVEMSWFELPVWMIFLVAWTLIQLVANNVDWVMDRMRRKVDDKIHFNIQAEGFTHLIRLPVGYHKNVHINGEIQKISQAGWRMEDILYLKISYSDYSRVFKYSYRYNLGSEH